MFKLIFKNKVSLILVIICLTLITAYYLGASRYSVRYFRTILNPLLESVNFTTSSISDFLSIYLNKQEFAQLNQELQKKVIVLSIKNIELATLRQENEFLKKELVFRDNYDFTNLIARIIGRGPDYTTTDLIINQGTLAGVKIGFAVTTDQGIIIGKISQVEDNISHIRLLNDNQSNLSAIVAKQKTFLGLVSGEHNLNLKIELLPKDIQLNENDTVATSGLDNNIPAGLLIGSIYKIDTSQEKLWQQALVESALDYSTVRWVNVIIPKINI